MFITIPSAKAEIDELVKTVDPEGDVVHVITIPKPNKRNQMLAGVNYCTTDIIVFCDDDAIWPDTMLKWILAPFEDRHMGGVGSKYSFFFLIPNQKELN